MGLPHYRKRGRDDRFCLTGAIWVGCHGVKLPRMGWVRSKEPTAKFRGRVLSATVRREADRWYVSLQVEGARPDHRPSLTPPRRVTRAAVGSGAGRPARMS